MSRGVRTEQHFIGKAEFRKGWKGLAAHEIPQKADECRNWLVSMAQKHVTCLAAGPADAAMAAKELRKVFGRCLDHPHESAAMAVALFPWDKFKAPDPLWCSLQAQGYLDKAPKTEEERKLVEVESEIWARLTSRATQEAKAEGAAMTPLLAATLKGPLNLRHSFVTPAVLSIMIDWKDQATEVDQKGYLDDNLEQAIEDFAAWAKTTSKWDQVKEIAQEPMRHLWPIVVENSPALGDSEEAWHIGRALGGAFHHALKNPHLNNRTAEIVTEFAIDRLFNTTADYSLTAFFRQLPERGFALTPAQVRRIKVVAMAVADGKGRKEDLDSMTNIRECGTDKEIRRILMSEWGGGMAGRHGAIIRAEQMIRVSQGKDWLDVVTTAAEDADGRQNAQTVQALQDSGAWHLQGVHPGDLTELAGHKDELVRQEARRLAVLAQDVNIRPGRTP